MIEVESVETSGIVNKLDGVGPVDNRQLGCLGCVGDLRKE